MTDADRDLYALAIAHGVHTAYHDLHGHEHVATPDTLRALLGALGIAADRPGMVTEQLGLVHQHANQRHLPDEVILISGQAHHLSLTSDCEWHLVDELGALHAEGRATSSIELPALQVGYYQLGAAGNGWENTARVLCRPPTAPQVQAPTWGVTGPLYALRSASNGGLGNYGDLGTVAHALGQHGAQFFGVNPLHALGWAMETIISPYSPSHRGFFNTDYIATDLGLGPTPASDHVDYPAYRKKHRVALEQEYLLFRSQGTEASFAQWCETSGSAAMVHAQFEALSEQHGHDFRSWPARLRQPGPDAEAAAGRRAEFHAWLQWRAEAQVEDAQSAARQGGMGLGLYLDLAVGPRPDGAEVWMHAETIADGITVGAPPDHLNPEGQSWALAAHAPERLAATGYAPFRAMLKKLMTRCGLLRIDHALGLLRSFWIPNDGSPGGYIRQPLDALLAVIAIEADKAGCVVVGEDLGLVPDGFREKLANAGLYSYAVWQYEARDDAALLPAQALSPHALACFATHDTPTLQGFWFGRDIEWWHRLGWIPDEERTTRHSQRARQRASLREHCGISADSDARGVAAAVQYTLAQAPSALVSVQLDDALHQTEAQNLPGTVAEHPNWCRRLPVPVEMFAVSDLLRDTANVMQAGRATQKQHPKTA